MEEKTRALWLDIAKAVGILVVLLVHTGRNFGPVSFYGGMFYMPIFFVIAGMTYRERQGEGFGTFLRRKARRLLLPYLAYNLFLVAFFFLKDSLAAGQVTAASFFPLLGILYSRNCLYPLDAAKNVYFMQILNAPTWFLTALFVSYAVFFLLLRAAKGDKKKAALGGVACLLAAALLHSFCPILLPWSIDCALYCVAFLLLGLWTREEKLVERLLQKPLLLLPLAAAFALLANVNGTVNLSVSDYGRSMLLYLAVGFLGSLLVLALARALEQAKALTFLARPLAFLGRHTLPVLCLHLFVYSVIGTVLGVLGL